MKYLLLMAVYLGMILNSYGTEEWKLSEIIIVANPKASPEVKLATQELQMYIKEITEHKINIIDPAQAKNYPGKLKINIGINANLKDIPELKKCEYDGAWIKTLSGDNLLISGRTPKGTEFGIYGFLENYCGVRWFLPGVDGTYVPKNPNLKIGKINKLSNPFFLSRLFSSPTLWGNYLCSEAGIMSMAWYRHNRMLQRFHCSHNLGNIIIPSVYKKEHPEYFPMKRNGKRFIPKTNKAAGWQPCMTNKDVIDICAKAAIRHFDNNPEEISFSIGVNDWGNYCHCPKCLDANGGMPKPNSRGLKDYSLLAFKFANKVAAKLQKHHKDKYVGMLAYANLRDYPKDFKFHPNVMVQRTTAFICYFNPADRKDIKGTLRFAKNTNMFSVYEYWYGVRYLIPSFAIGLMEEYIDELAKNNAKGWSSEIYQNWSMDGIKYYLLAKKLWNPQLRVSNLLNDYCIKMFGAGTSNMLEFYKICQERWENQTDIETTKYHLQGSIKQMRLFDVKTCEKLLLLLQDALKKAQNPHGKALITYKINTIMFTKSNSEAVELAQLIAKNIGDAKKLYPLCLAATKKQKEIKELRTKLRLDPFSLPSKSLGKPLGLIFQETIANTLYQACLAKKDMTLWDMYLDEVKKISQDLYQRARWYSVNIKEMEKQPELIANGDFNEGILGTRKIAKWKAMQWGSATVKSNIKLESEKGEKICLLEGVAYCFTYAPSPGISQNIKIKPNTWYVLKCLIKSDSPWTSVDISMYIPGKRFFCSVVAGDKWLPVVWVFKTPQKANKLKLRLSMSSLGKVKFDKVSMKEIPVKLAKSLREEKNIKIFPPMQKLKTLPATINIDFNKKLPPRTRTHVKVSNGIIKTSKRYSVLSVKHAFRGVYDIKIKIKASSSNGATLGLLALQYIGKNVRMKNQKIGKFKTKLSKDIKEYEFLYRYSPGCRKASIMFFRSNKKGTLTIEGVELIPVEQTKSLRKNKRIKISPAIQELKTLPTAINIDFNKKLPVGVWARTKVSNGIIKTSKKYNILSVKHSFKGLYDMKIKIKASSPDGATLGLLALQYRSKKVRMKNQKIGEFRTKLSKDMKEYEFLYRHNPECRKASFMFFRSNRKGTLKIEGLELIPVESEKNSKDSEKNSKDVDKKLRSAK